jgi:hypothetical protein
MILRTEAEQQFSDAVNAMRGHCSEEAHKALFALLRFGGEREDGKILILAPRRLTDFPRNLAGVLSDLKRTYRREFGITLEGICKPRTEVVNVRHIGDRWDTYIGRANRHWGLDASEWANPFRMSKHEDKARAQVVQMYRDWIVKQPVFVHIAELQGRRLACWCHPQECHGDVLAELADATLRVDRAPQPDAGGVEDV